MRKGTRTVTLEIQEAANGFIITQQGRGAAGPYVAPNREAMLKVIDEIVAAMKEEPAGTPTQSSCNVRYMVRGCEE